MVNYANSVVYKIMSLDPKIDDIYVGSTCAFRKRKHGHKTNCCNETAKYYNRYVYQFIRENSGWDNWSMVVVKAYPDITSKLELLNKERKWMKKLNATLNQTVPGKKLTLGETEYQKQYREQNKKVLCENRKQYYEKHKQILCDNQKQYREQNKEYIKQYNEKYRIENSKYIKQYRELNKEHLNQKAKEKIECECGRMIRRDCLIRHKKSTIHIKLMNNK
jgi:hypothetical protein